jgi:hypothetical protein
VDVGFGADGPCGGRVEMCGFRFVLSVRGGCALAGVPGRHWDRGILSVTPVAATEAAKQEPILRRLTGCLLSD